MAAGGACRYEVSNSSGGNLHFGKKSSRNGKACFKLHRSKFTHNGKFWRDIDRLVSNSSGGNLHNHSADDWIIHWRFQTPAEEIYTLFSWLFCFAAIVSNSSGGNLHRIHSCNMWHYTVSNSSGGNLHLILALHSLRFATISNSSGGNLHQPCNDAIMQNSTFQTPAEEIYTKRGHSPRWRCRISNSSGGNLHPSALKIVIKRPDFKLQRRKFTQNRKFISKSAK